MKRSQKIQKRASKAGFDWPDVEGVFNKIKEEIGELEEAINENHQESTKEEIGDLLMIMTNLAQKLNVDSEDALISANKKFINRFAYIETALENEGTGFSEASFEQLDSLWEDSKKLS